MKDRNNWNVTIAGECMISRPFAVHDDPASMRVIELLRDSDVTYAHLEMNLAEFDEVQWPAKAEGRGSFMIAKPQVSRDLRWAGVDIMSLAHNHTYDFGAPVVMSTIRHCREAELVVAGTGRDLEEAREPGYLETAAGRIALVSASSGNPGYQLASYPKASWNGRPGVNPQRYSLKYHVDPETAEQLKAGGRKLGVLRENGDEFTLFVPNSHLPQSWVVSDHNGIHSHCHEADLRGNMRAVEEARAMADLVMVAHHFNTSDGPRGDTPPEFAREFAHAAIANGADIYLGHGWHRTLGIEIYKGKPIFYGLGNFFSQTEFIQRVPADSYEAYGHDIERLQTLHPAVHPLHPGYDKDSDTWWSGAIIRLVIRDNRLREIRLIPVELGRAVSKEVVVTRSTGSSGHTLTEGRPLLAKGDNARAILDRYQRLSAEFGTEMAIEGTEGVIVI